MFESRGAKARSAERTKIIEDGIGSARGMRGFQGGTSGKEPACQCRRYERCRCDAWVGKIPLDPLEESTATPRSHHQKMMLMLSLWETLVGKAFICTSSSSFFFICSEFCHTLKWKGLGFTCLPHPDPPSHLPLHPLPPGPPRAPSPSACLICTSERKEKVNCSHSYKKNGCDWIRIVVLNSVKP